MDVAVGAITFMHSVMWSSLPCSARASAYPSWAMVSCDSHLFNAPGVSDLSQRDGRL